MDYHLLFDRIGLAEEARELYWKLDERRRNDDEFSEDADKIIAFHKDHIEECTKLTDELVEKYNIPLCSYQLYITYFVRVHV